MPSFEETLFGFILDVSRATYRVTTDIMNDIGDYIAGRVGDSCPHCGSDDLCLDDEEDSYTSPSAPTISRWYHCEVCGYSVYRKYALVYASAEPSDDAVNDEDISYTVEYSQDRDSELGNVLPK